MIAARSVATLICASFMFAAPPASARTFTAKGIACDNPQAIGELTRLAAANNRDVFDAYALVRIVHGECIELSAGTKVTIEAADPSNIAIRVCPSEVDCWWMSPEMVDGLTPEGLQRLLDRRGD